MIPATSASGATSSAAATYASGNPVLAEPPAHELVLLDEGDPAVQVGQPDRREDPVDPVPLEHGRGVVVVVADAVVEGEHEAVRDRRTVARRREQRVRLERLVVAEQVLDLALEVGSVIAAMPGCRGSGSRT